MTQTHFIFENMLDGRKLTVCSMAGMTIEDAVKAVEVYDRIMLNRREPRRARHAKDQPSLARSYRVGSISRSTYYRRLRKLGLPPQSPKITYED